MSPTHDYIVSNASGASVRADLNNALAAIVSNNSNATSPATTYAYQWWADTTAGTLKLRNSANSAWITIFELDGTMLMESGTAAAPGLAFADDLNTGIHRPAADHFGITTGGTQRVLFKNDLTVFNDGGNDVDFRVESNSNTHMLFVDGGNDRVSIGAASPSNGKLEITNSTNGDEGIRLSDTRATPSANKRTVDIRYTGTNGRTASNTQLLYLYDNNSSSTQPFMEVENASSSLFVIDSSGNVGIGTSSASSPINTGRLMVQNGDIVVRDDLSGNAYRRGVLVFDIRNSNGDSKAAYIQGGRGSDTSSNIQFHTTVSHALSERARIDDSGRLLLGTSSAFGATASELLQVANANGGKISLLRNDASIASGNEVGVITWYSADGNTQPVASVACFADGDHATNDKPGRLVFSTTADNGSSTTERMRISSGGNLLFNCTSLPGAGTSTTGVGFSSADALLVHRSAATACFFGRSDDGEVVALYSGTTQRGTIFISGATTTYTSVSDYRLKENILDLDNAINRVKGLTPKRFNFIDVPNITVDGFIAHEAQTVVPEAVIGTHDEVDADGNPVYQGIDHSKLVPLLTAALQEAIVKIETLETKVAALEAG